MSHLTEANEASRSTILSMDSERARRALVEIHDVLWPRENPLAVEWTEKHAEAIAKIVRGAIEREDESPAC